MAYDAKFTPPGDSNYRRHPALNTFPELRHDWDLCGTPADDWTADDFRRWGAAWPRLLHLVRRYHEAGVLLATGSDITNPWVIPGESLHQELELLVSAGIAPLAVTRMATRNGAEALGILDQVGTIEPGKRADLLLLRENPAERIGATRSIARVMQAGRWVDP